MKLTRQEIEDKFLDTAMDSHDIQYNEGFKDGFEKAQESYQFSENDVIEFMYKLFKHTPSGTLQQWELRHYGAFIRDMVKKSKKEK